jgi:hypothetical protein
MTDRPCCRAGCPNSRCYLLAGEFGCICNPCADEFVSKQPKKKIQHNDLIEALRKFLGTPHPRGYSKLMTATEFIFGTDQKGPK